MYNDPAYNNYRPEYPGYNNETFQQVAYYQGRTVQIENIPWFWELYYVRRFVNYMLASDERLQTMFREKSGAVNLVFVSQDQAQTFAREASTLRCKGHILSVRWLNPTSKKI